MQKDSRDQQGDDLATVEPAADGGESADPKSSDTQNPDDTLDFLSEMKKVGAPRPRRKGRSNRAEDDIRALMMSVLGKK